MRTHIEIIETIGVTALAERLYGHMPAGRWPSVRSFANTVQAWKRAKSIPAEYWQAAAEADVASLEELAAAAARRVAA